MNYNHKKLSLFAIPLLAILVIAIYITKTFTSVGAFVFDFSIASLIVFITLLFVRQEVFHVWSKFTMFFIPLTIVVVLLVPKISSDPFFPIEKKVVAVFAAAIFLVVSMIIIIFKSIQLRKEQK